MCIWSTCHYYTSHALITSQIMPYSMNNTTATQKSLHTHLILIIPFTDILSTTVCKCNGKQEVYLLDMSSLIKQHENL